MKLSVAAAALAFSGTALMFAPTAASAAPVGAKAQTGTKIEFHRKSGMDTTATKAGLGGDFAKAGWQGGDFAKADADMTGKAGVHTAKLDAFGDVGMGGPFEEASLKGSAEAGDMSAKLAGGGKTGMADAGEGAKFQNASMDAEGKNWAGHEGMEGMEGKLAGADMTAKGAVDSGKQMASGPVGTDSAAAAVDTAAVMKEPAASGAATGDGKQTYAGMGGPEEAVDSYPPCRPGPGDDRCIQLYEVGSSAKA